MQGRAGAICVIETGGHHKDPKTGEEVRNGIRGVLAEGVNINLQSEYQQLVSDSDMGDENVVNIINAAGTLMRSFTGGHAGQGRRSGGDVATDNTKSMAMSWGAWRGSCK